MAFIVDVDGAPCVGDRAVVDGGNLFVGNLLAQLAGKLALAVSDGGCFQRVAAGFVENNAAEAVFNGNGHHLGGAVAGTGHGDRLTGCMDTHILGQNHFEHFKTHPAAGIAGTGLGTVALVGNGADHHAGTDLAVLGVQAFGGSKQNVVVHIQQCAAYLRDRSIIFLGGKIALLQDCNLLLVGHGRRHDADGMNIPKYAFLQHNINGRIALAQRIGGGLRAADQASFAGVHSGCHDGAQTLVNAHGRAGNNGIFDRFHFVGDHVDGMVDGIFCEDFRVIGTGGHRFLQNPQAEFL